MRPPEALSKWLWQLWLKGRQWLQCGADKKTSETAPSNSLSKTFLQHSCNIPTMLLLLNEPQSEMFSICFGNVLRLLWSAFDVTLPHIVTFMEARATFWSLALHPLSFTCQVHKYLWSMFYAKGLMKYIVCYIITVLCSSNIFLHLFFYQCFLVPLIIICVKNDKCCLQKRRYLYCFDGKNFYIVAGFILNCRNAWRCICPQFTFKQEVVCGEKN